MAADEKRGCGKCMNGKVQCMCPTCDGRGTLGAWNPVICHHCDGDCTVIQDCECTWKNREPLTS